MSRLRIVVEWEQVGMPDDLVVVSAFAFARRTARERKLPLESTRCFERFDQQQPRLRVGSLHEREDGSVEHAAAFAFVPVERLRQPSQLSAVTLVRTPAKHR